MERHPMPRVLDGGEITMTTDESNDNELVTESDKRKAALRILRGEGSERDEEIMLAETDHDAEDWGEDASAEFVSESEAEMAGLEVGAVFENDDHYRLEITDRTPGGGLIYSVCDDHGSRIETVGGSVDAVMGKLDVDGYERLKGRRGPDPELLSDPVFWQRVALEAIHNNNPAKALKLRVGAHFESHGAEARVYRYDTLRVQNVAPRHFDEWIASAEFEVTTKTDERGILVENIKYTDFPRMER